jgi:hypothetical protein
LFLVRRIVLAACPPWAISELRKVWRRLYAMRMAADT